MWGPPIIIVPLINGHIWNFCSSGLSSGISPFWSSTFIQSTFHSHSFIKWTQISSHLHLHDPNPHSTSLKSLVFHFLSLLKLPLLTFHSPPLCSSSTLIFSFYSCIILHHKPLIIAELNIWMDRGTLNKWESTLLCFSSFSDCVDYLFRGGALLMVSCLLGSSIQNRPWMLSVICIVISLLFII